MRLMFDLQHRAFASEITARFEMKFGIDAHNRVFPEERTMSPFHSASHHGNTPSGIPRFCQDQHLPSQSGRALCRQADDTPDGDGSLLDHSLVLYGSAMGDSNVHNHRRVPFTLIGHASGSVKGNMHIRCNEGTPQGNGLLAVLQKLGWTIEKVGDTAQESFPSEAGTVLRQNRIQREKQVSDA